MRAEIGGHAVSYELAGKDDAPAIVFIHGLAGSLAAWSGQAERLADRFRVLRYDLRSHGGSAAVDLPCTLFDLAADLIGLLDHLSIARAALVGHSAGGVIAMRTAIDHAERVSALVLVGTASECNDKTAAWYAEAAATARHEGGESAMRAMGMRVRGNPVPDGATLCHPVLAIRTLNEAPLTEAIGTTEIPTLIVVGDKDFLGAGGSVILHRAIAGSELEIVADRGHAIHLEDPDWFADRLSRFLTHRP